MGEQFMIIKNILIADENDYIRKTIIEKFQNSFDFFHHFIFFEAKDGEEALDLIGTNNIHLAIIDSNLPKINGIEVLRTIKNTPFKSHIPVIILTNNIHRATRVKAYELGAVGVIPKPFSPLEVVILVKSLLKTQDEYLHFSEVIHLLSFIMEISDNDITLIPQEIDGFLEEYFTNYGILAYYATKNEIVYNRGFEEEEISRVFEKIGDGRIESVQNTFITISLTYRGEKYYLILKIFSNNKRFYLLKKLLELWSELNDG